MPREAEAYDLLQACVSANFVAQREMVRFHGGSPSALSEAVAVRVARRVGVPASVFVSRRLTRDDLVSRCHPAISDERIGHPALAPPEPGEFQPEPDTLRTYTVRIRDARDRPAALSERQRATIERVPGFVVEDGGLIRVRASSATLVAEWVNALCREPM